MLGAKVYGISDCIPTEPSNFQTIELREEINDIRINIQDSDDAGKIIKGVISECIKEY